MHTPVMTDEVIMWLAPKPNARLIDCTVGEGGHSKLLLARIQPNGAILGFEWDHALFSRVQNEMCLAYGDRFVLVCENFANLERVASSRGFKNVSGVLLDLGLSSWHIKESGRGFTFQNNEPLDMRFSDKADLTAMEIVNYWKRADIEYLLFNYGQERFARRITREIMRSRPLKTTFDLIEAIRNATPGGYRRQKIHFATKTFQALRIAVNNELDNLQTVLPQAVNLLVPNGRLVVISFHSLEDGIVKRFIKEQSRTGTVEALTKKPLTPSINEVVRNPYARSAKLRVLKKTLISE